MLLVHTDYGRALIESLATANPNLDTLFFVQPENLNLASDTYYQDVTLTAGGVSFSLQVRFFDRDEQKMLDGLEVFTTDGYQKVASVSYVEVPAIAGSLTYLDDKLYLTGANDEIYDSGGNDLIDLSDGDDVYHYLSGNDEILGGGGWDVVKMTVTHDTVVSTQVGSGYELAVCTDATVTLSNVERVEFADGATLAYDLGAWSTAGGAYRLYQAAFDRVPDASGLKFWIDAIDGGRDFAWVAANFIYSAEFQDTYGTPGTVSDAAFVDLLYQNVLGRAGEAGGVSYWNGELASGMDRSLVLLSFSESAENQAGVATAIHDGIWF